MLCLSDFSEGTVDKDRIGERYEGYMHDFLQPIRAEGNLRELSSFLTQ